MVIIRKMQDFKRASKNYWKVIEERKNETRAYKPYQLTGLELANILNDSAHKSLYIKLAKTYNADVLIGLAKRIAEREDVANRGAYFMKSLSLIKNGKG